MNIRKYTGLLLSLLLVSACSDSGAPSPEQSLAQQSLDAEKIAANNHAVGMMGRFEYAQAHTLFSEIINRQPGWNEVKVNLAVATLNRQQAGDDLAALELAREVLQAEPGNLRARYLSGLVQLYIGAPVDALSEFQYVTEADPADAYAAYYLAQCHAQLGGYDQALPWYQRAMELDPYLRSAYYGAFQSLQRLGRPQEAQVLADDYQRLENNPRSRLAEFKYTRMGSKAGALTIDLAEAPSPQQPEGALFTGPESVLIENEAALSWQRVPAGRTPGITTVDMQGDGRPDLFVTGVLELPVKDGEPASGNLVLQGLPGNGYTALVDHPLAAVGGVNAALWGDFDNDGLVDVYLCRSGENQLWRQTEKGVWLDVTASTLTAGGDLDTVDGAFFDADHDGDLDLFLVNADGPNELLNNNLDGTFRPLAQAFGLAGTDGQSLMVLPVDLDNDRDVDLIVLNRTGPHEVFINDRLWTYHPATAYEEFNNSPALAVLAADIDADGRTELYTITPAGDLLRWLPGSDGNIRSGNLGATELLQNVAQAQLAAHDVNGDGVLDLIVSSPRGWTVLAISTDGVEALYAATTTPQNMFSAFLPFIGASKSGPAMLALSQASGDLSVWQPGAGRYPFITLALSGRQVDAESMRSNASGVGTRLAVRTGSRWSLLQNYRNFSGPGQSLQPLAVGLKGAPRADFVSINWSDGVLQTEINVAAGQFHQLTETQRQLSSCPVLFAWNGEEYAFVSDLLGVGGIGYAIGPGEYSTPRPWENFLLPEGLLQEKNGRYELKIAEPMEENAYLDAARLVVYDLPPDWSMVMDERLAIGGPEPTGEARFYRRELLPKKVFNDRGENVLSSVLEIDGVAAPVGGLDPRFIAGLTAAGYRWLGRVSLFANQFRSLAGRRRLCRTDPGGLCRREVAHGDGAVWLPGGHAASHVPAVIGLAAGDQQPAFTHQFTGLLGQDFDRICRRPARAQKTKFAGCCGNAQQARVCQAHHARPIPASL